MMLIATCTISASGDLHSGLNGSYPALQAVKLQSTSGDIKAALSGDFPTLRELKIAQSSGDVQVAVNGTYRAPLVLTAISSSGNCALDLNAQWQADLHAKIRNAAGNLLLRLPETVGVIAAVQRVSGAVQMAGMERKGDGFVNAMYGHSAVILNLDLGVVSGNMRLYCGARQ